jgi:hypothetical protein
MPWTPPADYQPRDHNDLLLRSGTPQVGTAEFKVVVMAQHGLTPEQVGMTPQQARTAIDDWIVPLMLYGAILDLALSGREETAAELASVLAEGWSPPQRYRARRHNDILLRQGAPRVGTAEFKVVVMTQHHRTPDQVGLTMSQARSAIDQRIVPMALYPAVLEVATAPAGRLSTPHRQDRAPAAVSPSIA